MYFRYILTLYVNGAIILEKDGRSSFSARPAMIGWQTLKLQTIMKNPLFFLALILACSFAACSKEDIGCTVNCASPVGNARVSSFSIEERTIDIIVRDENGVSHTLTGTPSSALTEENIEKLFHYLETSKSPKVNYVTTSQEYVPNDAAFVEITEQNIEITCGDDNLPLED